MNQQLKDACHAMDRLLKEGYKIMDKCITNSVESSACNGIKDSLKALQSSTSKLEKAIRFNTDEKDKELTMQGALRMLGEGAMSMQSAHQQCEMAKAMRDIIFKSCVLRVVVL